MEKMRPVIRRNYLLIFSIVILLLSFSGIALSAKKSQTSDPNSVQDVSLQSLSDSSSLQIPMMTTMSVTTPAVRMPQDCHVLPSNSSDIIDRNLVLTNYTKIYPGYAGLPANLFDDYDYFGHGVRVIGDLDKDGNIDIAVSAKCDDDGGENYGAIYIIFLNSNLSIKNYQKISDTEGGFTGDLTPLVWGGVASTDAFGCVIEPIGDLDGDGYIDLAVSAEHDDDGSFNKGAVWILFLNPDGTVKSHQKISDTYGNFTAYIPLCAHLGSSLAYLGDMRPLKNLTHI